MPLSPQKRKIELVIFDCDGVLVDSEVLSASVLMQMMSEVGMPLTPEIFRSDFLGRSFASAAARATQRFGRPMPEDFAEAYRTRLLTTMVGNLQAMPGVERVLAAMSVTFCLATGSSPPRLAVSMAETGLEEFFNGRSFTASMVRHGKPAPDLFLHVAAEMKVKPISCLVIEDSEMGVSAALAANMQVWHFAGGGHIKGGYCLPLDLVPHRVLDSMPALLDAFREIGIAA